MAVKTIATRLVLDGEAEYRAKLKNINAELSLQKSELEKIQAQYKNNANGMEALTAKQSALAGRMAALNEKHREQSAMLDKAREAQQKYARMVEELKGRLAELANSSGDTSEEQKKLQAEIDAAEEAMQKAANSVTFYQKQLNNTERDQAKLGEELERTGRYLDEAKSSADGCARSIDQYGKEVKRAGDSSEQFGNTSKEAVNQLAAALAAAGVAKSVKEIADALMDCVDSFAQFQSQMSTVQAISGASGQEMDALAEKARYMGATTAFTAAEAGQALEYMAMAGWKTGDMLGGLEGVMNLAAASGESLGTTSDIVTDALTAFGLAAADSARFADVLAAASSNSNTNVAMMGETFKYAAPVAGALGYSIEDVALAIGLMANAGIKGSQAGTALRGTLTNLAKPSDDVLWYMEELGVSMTDSAGQTRSLSELMDVLRDRFSALTEAQQAEYAAGIAGKEAMSGLLAIVNASEADYQKLTEAITASSGAAREMSEIRLDNLQGQMTLLSSAADGLKLAVGEQLTPVLTDLAQAGTEAFAWSAEFVSENEWVVGAVVGLTAAFGALTAGVIIYEKRTELATAKTAILNAVMDANPAVFVASALIGLVTAIGIYSASVDDAGGGTKEFTKSLQESKQAYEELQDAMEERQGSTKATADALKDLLAVEDKSAAQKAVILDLIEQLNEAVPGLNLAYDSEKDALAGLTGEEVKSAIARAEAQEENEARVERLSELYAQQSELSARLTEAEETLAAAYESGVTHADAYSRASGGAGAAVRNAEAAVRTLTSAYDENAAEIAELEAATNAYTQQQDAEALATETMTARVDDLTARMQSLEEEYQKSYDKAMESIEAQLGLFNELDGTAKTSIDSLIGTLEGQVAYMDQYAANIKRAMELGVDEGLVKKLSDGSEKSAQILDAIVNGGKEDIAALNEQFAKVEEGKEAFSDTVAQMETEFNEKMGQIVDDLNAAIEEMNQEDAAYQVGRNNVLGLVDGTADPEARQALIREYQQMAKDALAAYKGVVRQASPSKEFNQTAQYDVQGLIEGVEAKRASLAAAYEDLARLAMESYAGGVRSNLEAVAEAMAQFDAAAKDLDSFYELQANVRELEYQLWERTEGKNASEMEKYARQLELLRQKQAEQQEVVDAAAAAYQAAVEQYGEGTEGSYQYQQALLQEKLALQELLEEIEKVTAAKKELERQAFLEQVKARWESSGPGQASAAAWAAGYTTPYEVAQIAGIGLTLPDGTAYAPKAREALDARDRHQASFRREPPARGDLGRQMEQISAATVNAISSAVSGMSRGPTIVKVMIPNGDVLAEVVADPLVDRMDANGTPIVNRR